MKKNKVLIYGSGGFGREVAWLAHDADYDVLAFIDDDSSRWGQQINGIPVVSIEEAAQKYIDVPVTIAIAHPSTRKTIYEKVKEKGFNFVNLIHPRTEKSEFVEIGKGCTITAGNIITVNVKIKNFVHINPGCTIGHDVIIHDFATLTPGVHVAGWVFIHEGAFIGTGAVIINGTPDAPLEIGSYAVVGAGAVVTRSVPPGITVVGVPAKPLER